MDLTHAHSEQCHRNSGVQIDTQQIRQLLALLALGDVPIGLQGSPGMAFSFRSGHRSIEILIVLDQALALRQVEYPLGTTGGIFPVGAINRCGLLDRLNGRRRLAARAKLARPV